MAAAEALVGRKNGRNERTEKVYERRSNHGYDQ